MTKTERFGLPQHPLRTRGSLRYHRLTTALSAIVVTVVATSTSEEANAERSGSRRTQKRESQILELRGVASGDPTSTHATFIFTSQRGLKKKLVVPKNQLSFGLSSFNNIRIFEGYLTAREVTGKQRTPQAYAELLASVTEENGGAPQGFVRFAFFRKTGGGTFVSASPLTTTQQNALRQILAGSNQPRGNVFFEANELRKTGNGGPAKAESRRRGGRGNSGCACYEPPPPPPPACGCYSNPPAAPSSPSIPTVDGQGHCSSPSSTPCGRHPQTGYQWCCESPVRCVMGLGCSSEPQGNCHSAGYSWSCPKPELCGAVPGTCNPETGDPGTGLSDPPVVPPAPRPRCEAPLIECTYANNACMLQGQCDTCKKYGRSEDGPVSEAECAQHCNQIANEFFEFCMRTSDLPSPTKEAYCGQAREAEFERCRGGCETCALRRDGGGTAKPPSAN